MKKHSYLLLGSIFVLIAICGVIWKIFFTFNDSLQILNPASNEPALFVINVLDKEEFDDAHITNSICLSMSELSEMLKIADQSTILVFYCANYLCSSSDEAALSALDQGFQNVYVYKGGMSDWYQMSKYESEYHYDGPAKKSYLNIIITPPEHFIYNDKLRLIKAPELLALMKEHNLM